MELTLGGARALLRAYAASAGARSDREPGDPTSARVWAAAPVVAVATVAAMYLLGPRIGDWLYPKPTLADFWPSALHDVRPEPTEQARYLVMLAGVAVFAIWSYRSPRVDGGRTSRVSPMLGKALLVAVIAAGLVGQAHLGRYAYGEPDPDYFGVFALVAAAVVATVAVFARQATHGRTSTAGRPADRADRGRSVAGWTCALVWTVVWLLQAVHLDSTIGGSPTVVAYHVQFPLDDVYAVINGRTPLVNMAAQYGSLWSLVIAGPLKLLGGTLGAFTALMAALSAVGMLAIYAVLRRVTRRPSTALLLYVPFVAVSFYWILGPSDNRYSFATYYGVFPERYAGPMLLAALVARCAGRGWSASRLVAAGVLAGLVVLNNVEFGIPALAATVAAAWISYPDLGSRRKPATFAAALLAGLVGAFALVSLVTLARTGALPDLSLLVRYATLFGSAGYMMLRMAPVGLHLVLAATFLAALTSGLVRAGRGAPNPVLTSMLVWSGVFGFGAGSYFVGRSHPEVLIALFPAWGLALMLLTAQVFETRRESRRPTFAECCVLLGFGLTVSCITQVPDPVAQMQRLGHDVGTTPLTEGSRVRFVRATSRPGEPVLLLMELGHRIAADAGVKDVLPYSGPPSMPRKSQLDEALNRLFEAGGSSVITADRPTLPIPPGTRREYPAALRERGFTVVSSDPAAGLTRWERTRTR